MGSSRRRIERVEASLGDRGVGRAARTDAEEAIRTEVRARMSVGELREYVRFLRRMLARGEPYEPAQEDLPILRRWQVLYEEVRDEFEASA